MSNLNQLEKLALANQALRDALHALDAGDCMSGGDYHSSRIGRHVVHPAGSTDCPACAIRRVLDITDPTDPNC